MRKLIVTVLFMAALALPGCSSPETVAMIAGAGSGATHTLLGINKDLETALVAKNIELQETLERIDNATTEAEKIVAEAKAKALEKQIETIGDAQTGTVLVEEGLKTDWTDPEAVGGYAGYLIIAVLVWLNRKKGKKYSAMKTGVNKFMANDDGKKSAELYEIIGAERARNGV